MVAIVRGCQRCTQTWRARNMKARTDHVDGDCVAKNMKKRKGERDCLRCCIWQMWVVGREFGMAAASLAIVIPVATTHGPRVLPVSPSPHQNPGSRTRTR